MQNPISRWIFDKTWRSIFRPFGAAMIGAVAVSIHLLTTSWSGSDSLPAWQFLLLGAGIGFLASLVLSVFELFGVTSLVSIKKADHQRKGEH
jgi:ABC-type Fe3+-siderophore transport system permease subunit